MAKRKTKIGKDADGAKEREYFAEQRRGFEVVATHAGFIGNKIGRQIVDPRRAMASWLFIRACVTARSMMRLFEPTPSGFGDISYVDHASIANLSRATIENVTVLLYVGDVSVGEEEWICRKHVIDLFDYLNRNEFLQGIKYQGAHTNDDLHKMLKGRVEANPFFKTIPRDRQKRLLKGDDMFIPGRHQMMLRFGWGNELTKAVYKYLSHQAHSQAMAFHRTEANRLYEQDSGSAEVTAAFATEFARKALGRACVHMIELFPYIGAAMNPLALDSMQAEYGEHNSGA